MCSLVFLFYNIYLLFFNEKNIKKGDFTDTLTCKLACLAATYSLLLNVYFKFGKHLFFDIYLSIILGLLTLSILVVCLFEKQNKSPLTKLPKKFNAKVLVIYMLVAYKVLYVPIIWNINQLRYAFTAGNAFFSMSSVVNILILIMFVTIFYYQFKNKRQSNLIK